MKRWPHLNVSPDGDEDKSSSIKYLGYEDLLKSAGNLHKSATFAKPKSVDEQVNERIAGMDLNQLLKRLEHADKIADDMEVKVAGFL